MAILETTNKTIQGLSTANSVAEINKLANNAITNMTSVYTQAAAAMNQVAPLVQVINQLGSVSSDPGAIISWLQDFVSEVVGPYMSTYTNNASVMSSIEYDVNYLQAAYTNAMSRVSNLTPPISPIPNDLETLPSSTSIPELPEIDEPYFNPPNFTLPTISITPLS